MRIVKRMARDLAGNGGFRSQTRSGKAQSLCPLVLQSGRHASLWSLIFTT